MRLRRLSLLLAIPALLAVHACTDPAEESANNGGNNATNNGDNNGSAGGELLLSNLPRDTAPNASDAEVGEVADGNTAFGLEFYALLRQDEPGNIFFSPYSMTSALAMTYGGARGNTAAQMESALHLTLGQAGTHRGINTLDLALAGRPAESTSEGDPFELRVTNAIWGAVGYPFEGDYLDLLAVNYGAGLRTLDFYNAPEPSRLTINGWVEDQTNDRIKDLIPEGAISSDTRLVLTNAIYFNASWDEPFEVEATSPAAFHVDADTETTVDMMHQTGNFAYGEFDGGQALSMSYGGGLLSMVVLLPEEGGMDALESSLTAARLEEIASGMGGHEVAISFPKFEFEAPLIVNAYLQALGMTDAFDSSVADFSGIVDPSVETVFISRVIHKAFVKVDEEGTEAAAATAVILDSTTGAPDEPVPFTADRPFIFLIRDNPTGAVLFVGRVVDPG